MVTNPDDNNNYLSDSDFSDCQLFFVDDTVVSSRVMETGPVRSIKVMDAYKMTRIHYCDVWCW